MDDALQQARTLYAAGEIRRALEAAQAAAERAPKSPAAWQLLAQVSRHAGMPRASDDAFRRAAQLSRRHQLPIRLSGAAFGELVESVTAGLSPDARRRLAGVRVRLEVLPTEAEIRAGIRPDAAAHRARRPEDVLTLYQANLENRARSEAELRGLVERALSRT
jgi:tetratricopeptide (TPR) repeat protein